MSSWRPSRTCARAWNVARSTACLSSAGLDIGAKLGEVSELKTIVDRTEKRLAAMGGGGLFNGIATTAAERQRAQEQELRAAQDALDNGYR